MRLSTKLKTTFVYVSCLMLTCVYPMSVYAEEPSTPPTTGTEQAAQPAPETTSTTTQPATPDTTSTTTAPSSTTTTPSTPPKTYSYDSTNGRWNSNEWTYDPVTNSYVPTAPAPVASSSSEPPAVVTPSTEQTPSNTTGTSTLTADTKTEIANALNSLAQSGDAMVDKNTVGGSAATGDAAATATIVNNVNSTMTNANNQEAASFVSNVMGDVNGDIMLQPMLLKAMLETNPALADQSVVINNDTSLTNDVNLTATSGDASVTKNTKAGDATTGSANTVADVVNLVNSMVAANQSFVGTINIYGNLNGDILIAPDFIPQLLASNDEDQQAATVSKVSTSDTQSIVNNVSLAAESGAALVSGNTAAGNAKTGDAATNLVIFNLSGHEIVASNSLLVFINVLGTWVGVIVDAPVGATAAAIGNGVTTNNVQPPSLSIDAVNETAITNNINLASQSGDASVTGNTRAGNAQTGDATASANIANISNSTLGLTGWFGILFINVFGTWEGSFGIDTAAGEAATPARTSTGGSGPSPTRKVIQFIPHTKQQAPASLHVIDPSSDAVNDESQASASFASAQKTPSDTQPTSAASDIPSQESIVAARTQAQKAQLPLAAASLLVMGASLYALRRFIF